MKLNGAAKDKTLIFIWKSTIFALIISAFRSLFFSLCKLAQLHCRPFCDDKQSEKKINRAANWLPVSLMWSQIQYTMCNYTKWDKFNDHADGSRGKKHWLLLTFSDLNRKCVSKLQFHTATFPSAQLWLHLLGRLFPRARRK
jgi:hypothetical protein